MTTHTTAKHGKPIATITPAKPRLQNTAEAAAYVNLEPRTLEMMRQRGNGPPFIRVSARAIRYKPADLDAWIEARRCRSTADGRAI